MRPAICLAFLAVALSGCATGYQPRDPDEQGAGYSGGIDENGKGLVNFRGNFRTERADVDRYVLRRAAELCLELGYDGFRTTSWNRMTYQWKEEVSGTWVTTRTSDTIVSTKVSDDHTYHYDAPEHQLWFMAIRGRVPAGAHDARAILREYYGSNYEGHSLEGGARGSPAPAPAAPPPARPAARPPKPAARPPKPAAGPPKPAARGRTWGWQNGRDGAVTVHVPSTFRRSLLTAGNNPGEVLPLFLVDDSTPAWIKVVRYAERAASLEEHHRRVHETAKVKVLVPQTTYGPSERKVGSLRALRTETIYTRDNVVSDVFIVQSVQGPRHDYGLIIWTPYKSYDRTLMRGYANSFQFR